MRTLVVSRSFVLASALGCLASPAFAEVKLPAVISDHMVLLQNTSAPVWGWAAPGEKVTVSLGSERQSATAGPDGKWMVRIQTPAASATPTALTVAGTNTLTVNDVLIGEVWLGSGQSNMEFSVSKKVKSWAGAVNEAEEIAAANYPQVRMFTVRMKLATEPQQDCEGSWQVCTPETVPAFSAIGYFFSRDLHKLQNIPVGFINSSYGASTAQAWINPAVLQADPQFKPLLDTYEKTLAAYDARAAQPAPATAPGTRAARAPRNPRQDQHNPSQCYNAMLLPVQPYAIRGVLWYQGESITGSLEEFAALNSALITSWRKEWDNPTLPFYFVQLAAQDANSNRPEVGEAQAKALALPNTGMAVAVDIGEKSNVHPRNKQEVAARLLRLARANVYGEKIESSGPTLQSMKIEGNTGRLIFAHTGKGLVAKDGNLKWFQIAGPDGKFVDAAATVEGNTVIVSSPKVPNPTNVRYAWNRWPAGANLYNADGLPAPAFRTDGAGTR
jgi:sialate O-acetylesterase